jgi:hypothetical protein
VLAIAVTVVIGASLAAMLMSVSTGVSDQTETQALMVGHAAALGPICEAVRASKMVLASGQGVLVLWIPGPAHGDSPRLSELCSVEHSATGKQLFLYHPAADLGPVGDTEILLDGTDFLAIAAAAKAKGTFSGRLLATGVEKWDIALDQPDPQRATFVYQQLTLSADDQSETRSAGAALRNARSGR